MLSNILIRTFKYSRFKIGQYIGELGGGIYIKLIINYKRNGKIRIKIKQ